MNRTVLPKKKERKRRLTAPEVLAMQKLCHERIISDIHANKTSPGMPLPGIRILSKQYNIPLSVVRSTLDELKNEGILESIPREGVKLRSVPSLPATLKGKRFAIIANLNENNPRHILNPPIQLANSIEPVLNEQGGQLVFINYWRYRNCGKILELIDSEFIDAIFYMESLPGGTAFLRNIRSRGIPIVSFAPDAGGVDSVDFDQEEIGRLQAEHLLGLGHRRIAVFYFPEKNWSVARTQGTAKEFRRCGMPGPDLFEFYFERNDTEGSILRLLPEIAGKYSAFIATNDIMAERILEASERLGLSVPKDFSLIGADNLEFAVLHNLTTVHLSQISLGYAAFDILKKRLLSPEPVSVHEKIRIPCSLFRRNSTKPIAEPEKEPVS